MLDSNLDIKCQMDSYFPLNKTTLWMGDLEPWMDENYLQRLWYNLNANVIIKIIRDKHNFTSSGYAFIGFESVSAAQTALDMFNGEKIPNTLSTFKLNWASGGGIIDRKEDRQIEYSIFLGDLTFDCTEQLLLSIFQSRYGSCKSVKIMTDRKTGLTRGYGFVRFTDSFDQQRAIQEMQGFMINNKPIRVSLATPKHHNESNVTSPTSSKISVLVDPTLQNTTVFIGGLSCPITEIQLKNYFCVFGDIVYVKIPPGKGCGFVQFVTRQSAELAIEQMNGFQIGTCRIRLSWGRSSQSIQPRQPIFNNQNQFKDFKPQFSNQHNTNMNNLDFYQNSSLFKYESSLYQPLNLFNPIIKPEPTNTTSNSSTWPNDYYHVFAQ